MGKSAFGAHEAVESDPHLDGLIATDKQRVIVAACDVGLLAAEAQDAEPPVQFRKRLRLVDDLAVDTVSLSSSACATVERYGRHYALKGNWFV